MSNTFLISDIFKTAWQYTKKHLGFFLASTFIFLVISIILGEISEQGDIWFLLSFVSAYISIVFQIGLIKSGVDVSKDKDPEIKNFNVDWITVARLFIAGIITTIFILLGFIFLVIPGIIISVRLFMTSFFIVDKNYSFWFAIRESWKITKGYSWKIFWLMFSMTVLSIVVFIVTFSLGLVFIIPFIAMIYVIASQKILSFTSQEVSKEVISHPVVVDPDDDLPVIREDVTNDIEEIQDKIEEIADKYTVNENLNDSINSFEEKSKSEDK